MCSTPKGSSQPVKKYHAGATLNAHAMARFTEVANAADERREQRRQEQKAQGEQEKQPNSEGQEVLPVVGWFAVLKSVLLMKLSFKALLLKMDS